MNRERIYRKSQIANLTSMQIQGIVLIGIVLIILKPIEITGQIITTDEILTKHFIDGQPTTDDLHEVYKRNRTMPWVDKLELRTETDEFDISQQEYLLRSSFNSKKERDAHKKLYQQQNLVSKMKIKAYNQPNSLIIYLALIDWYYSILLKVQIEQKKRINSDKKRVHEKLAQLTPNIDVAALLKVEDDSLSLSRDLQRLDQLVMAAMQILRSDQVVSVGRLLDTSNWVSMSQMEFVINRMPINHNRSHSLLLQKAKIDQAKLEYEYERVEGQHILDFVQLKYSGNDRLNFQREFSIGVGLNIPMRSNTRVKLGESAIEVYEEESKLAYLQRSMKESIESHRINLLNKISDYKILYRQFVNSKLTELQSTLINSGRLEPLQILAINERQLDKKLDLIKLEREICKDYILSLDIASMLIPDGNNIINYLKNKQ